LLIGGVHTEAAKALEINSYRVHAANFHDGGQKPFGAGQIIEVSSNSGEVHSEEYFISRNIKAARLHTKGRVSEAEGILRSVLKEAIATRGEDDKYTALTMLNLAEICIYQNQDSEAVELLDAVVSVYKKQIGPDHHKTADLIVRLASVHLSRGNIAEAEPLFEEVLRIRRKSLGAMHPATLLALDAVGGINYALGRFEDAHRLYTEALHGFEQAIGPMHEQSQRTRRNLTQAQSHLE
jgi:tetratricopeptide (TPR) repeat protein